MVEQTDSGGDEQAGGAVLNVHLHHLAYLREVARAGGVTRAAESLQLSQPALSQALAELERRLGVRLLERAGRGRRLTAAGQEVLAFAEHTLAGAAALERTLTAYGRGDGGILRAGMIDAAAIYLLPEVIRAYRAAYPAVDLRIIVATSGELVRRVRAFALDLAFVVGGDAEPDLRTATIARESLYWYASAGDTGEPERAGWALYPADSRTRRLIDAGFARHGIRPEVTLESANPDVLRHIALLGLGWTVLPPAVAEAPGAGTLRRGALVAERPVTAVWHRASAPDPRVERFLAMALPPDETSGSVRPPGERHDA